MDLDEYIDNMPYWYKHQQGHVIKIISYRYDGKIRGIYKNSGVFTEADATVEYHFGCKERDELVPASAAEIVKFEAELERWNENQNRSC